MTESRSSLRSRRLEVAGERENGRTRGRHARGDAHYFQAPATQASREAERKIFLLLFYGYMVVVVVIIAKKVKKLLVPYYDRLLLFDLFYLWCFEELFVSSFCSIKLDTIPPKFESAQNRSWYHFRGWGCSTKFSLWGSSASKSNSLQPLTLSYTISHRKAAPSTYTFHWQKVALSRV